MAMLDYQTYRPFGAPDQMGASQMFRNKPANSALQGALNAGGIPTPTQTPYSNTGVSGRATGGVPGYRPSMPAPAPQAPAPVDYSRAGSFLPGHGSGYNPEKDLVNGAGTSG